MFSRYFYAALIAVLVFTMIGCGNHPASDSVKAFVFAMSDSSWSDAWLMLTPETRATWDSTAVVFQHFGFAESSVFLATLSDSLTEIEFASMDGEMLFVKMVQSSPETVGLSNSVRDVEVVNTNTALVTIATSEGDQIIPMKLIEDKWLLDLTRLAPPPEIQVD